MKRWPRVMMMVAVWLVIGAGITVGVAWGVLWFPIHRLAISPPIEHWEDDGHDGLWLVHVTTDWHATEVSATRTGNVGDDGRGVAETLPDPALDRAPDWSMLGRLRANPHDLNWTGRVCEMASGWPFRAMRSQWSLSASQVETLENTRRFFPSPPPPTVDVGWDVRAFPRTIQSHVVAEFWPTRPVPLGFAIDTLLYAALAWGFWQLPVFLRRRHRRARNRCIRCGYSLAGLAAGAACPECGQGGAAPSNPPVPRTR